MSTDPNITAFVTYQNGIRSTSSAPFLLDTAEPLGFGQGTVAASATDAVIGWQGGVTALPTTATGTSAPLYNVLLLDGIHAAGSYQFNVDSTGKLTLTDTSTTDATAGQNMTVTGASYIVFNGGSASTSAGVYDSLFIIASNETNAEIARFYQSTFGRLPDLPGYEAWTLAVANGTVSMQQAAQDFITSAEFTSRYGAQAGMSDLQLVTQMYSNVLGRTPDPSGLSAWTTYLTGLETTNGNTAAGNLAARATVLQGFATSQEEISHSSTWLVDTGNGGYADTTTPVSAATALSQIGTTNILNGNLLAPLTATVTSPDYSLSANGTATGSAAFVQGAYVTAFTADSNTTIILGSNGTASSGYLNAFTLYGDSDTVYMNTPGQGGTVDSNNDIVHVGPHPAATGGYNISMGGIGAGISPTLSNPTNLTITGFVAGQDVFKSPLIYGDASLSPSTPTVTLLKAAISPVAGSSLNFATHIYVINLGNVGDGSAAAVAAAAATEYTPAGLAGTVPQGGASPNLRAVVPGENITLIGQVTSGAATGNTVVYDYANWQTTTITYTPTGAPGPQTSTVFAPTGNPDIHGTHSITADELTLTATLVGVTTNALSATDF